MVIRSSYLLDSWELTDAEETLFVRASGGDGGCRAGLGTKTRVNKGGEGGGGLLGRAVQGFK